MCQCLGRSINDGQKSSICRAKASLAEEEVSSSTMKLEAIKDITCAPEFGQISKWHGSTQISPSITDQLLMDADVAAPQQFLDAQVSYAAYYVCIIWSFKEQLL